MTQTCILARITSLFFNYIKLPNFRYMSEFIGVLWLPQNYMWRVEAGHRIVFHLMLSLFSWALRGLKSTARQDSGAAWTTTEPNGVLSFWSSTVLHTFTVEYRSTVQFREHFLVSLSPYENRWQVFGRKPVFSLLRPVWHGYPRNRSFSTTLSAWLPRIWKNACSWDRIAAQRAHTCNWKNSVKSVY